MGRTTGDTNFTLREKRLLARIEVYKAKVDMFKERLKVKDARIKELRAKVKAKK